MITNLEEAKMDLLDFDDISTLIDNEAKSIDDALTSKIQKHKTELTQLHEYFNSVGLSIHSEKHISPAFTLATIDCSVKFNDHIKPHVAKINYVLKNSKNLFSIKIDTINTLFNKHIIITSNKDTYDNLVKLNHTATVIILIDTKENILESKSYVKRASKNLTVTLPVRNSIDVKFHNLKAHTILHTMLRKYYTNFAAKTGLREFGSSFDGTSPTTSVERDPEQASAAAYLPFNTAEPANVKIDKVTDFILSGKEAEDAFQDAYNIDVRNTSNFGQQDVSIGDIEVIDKAEEYIKSKPAVLRFELDLFLNEENAAEFFYDIARINSKSVVNISDLKYVFKYARKNERYYAAERNNKLDNLNQVQNTWMTKINHVNQHYNLELKYHQIFGIVNTITSNVSILRADTGLGKTRAAIASCLARDSKHNLIVTEPGNVKELEREFREQLNMKDGFKIIKTEKDIKSLAKFNLVSYTTLSKVLKESALNDIGKPETKITLDHSNAQYSRTVTILQNIVMADINKNDRYDLYFYPNGVSFNYSTDTGLEHLKVSAKLFMALLYAENTTDILGKRTKSSYEHILNSIQSVIDTKSATFSISRNAKLTYDGTDRGSYLTKNSFYFSIRMAATIYGILEAMRAGIDIKSALEENFPSIYCNKQEYFDATIKILEEYKHLNTFGKLGDNNSWYSSNVSINEDIIKLVHKVTIATYNILISQMAETIKNQENEINSFSDRVDAQMKDTTKSIISTIPYNLRTLNDLLMNTSLFVTKMAYTMQTIFKAMNSAGYRYYKDIENIKKRAKFRERMLAGKLSGKFNTVIYDECHNLRNIDTSRGIAVTQLKAKNYLFMSATPISNKMSEVASYLVVGYGPRSLKTLIDMEPRKYNVFRHPNSGSRKRITSTISMGSVRYELDICNSRVDIDKQGFPPERIDRLIDANFTHVLRSNKDIVQDNAFQFTTKEYKVTAVPSEEHMQLYASQMEVIYEASRTGKYEDSREALSVLNNLIKISEVPHLISPDFENIYTNKQQKIIDLAVKQMEEGRSVIVFTWYTEMVKKIATGISQHTSKNVYMLHDGLTPDARFQLIDAFRKQEGNGVIVGTVSNLGKGFNLANADVIIMSDIPWVPLLYTQAIGRILRPDQKGKPEIFIVMNKYMVDMYKFDTIISKLNMLKKYLDKDNSISIEDTTKVDYKKFLLDLLNKAIDDKIIYLERTEEQQISEGI